MTAGGLNFTKMTSAEARMVVSVAAKQGKLRFPDPPKPWGRLLCDCGRVASHKGLGGLECDRCKRLNAMVEHKWDNAQYDPEYEQARAERKHYRDVTNSRKTRMRHKS